MLSGISNGGVEMRKAVPLVALAAIAAALLSWAGASASPSRVHRQVVIVRLVATNGYSVDNDPSGQSGGDLFGSAGELRHHGQKVGRFSSACTLAPPVGGQCQATLSLRGQGGVQIAGNVRFQGTHNRVAIVGGTGKFRTARGEATLDVVGGQGQLQRVRMVILR
jgi:hypothetical protein